MGTSRFEPANFSVFFSENGVHDFKSFKIIYFVLSLSIFRTYFLCFKRLFSGLNKSLKYSVKYNPFTMTRGKVF